MSTTRRTFVTALTATTAMGLGLAAFPPCWQQVSSIVMSKTPLESRSERIVAAIEQAKEHMRQRAREISDEVWSKGTGTHCTGLALLLADSGLRPGEITGHRPYEESAWG